MNARRALTVLLAPLLLIALTAGSCEKRDCPPTEKNFSDCTKNPWNCKDCKR